MICAMASGNQTITADRANTRQMSGLIIAAAAVVAPVALLSFAGSENSTRINPNSTPPLTAPN
jgi:hypothetical protein